MPRLADNLADDAEQRNGDLAAVLGEAHERPVARTFGTGVDLDDALGRKMRKRPGHRGAAYVAGARELGPGHAVRALDEIVEAHDIGALEPQASRLGRLDPLDLLVQGVDDADEILEAHGLHVSPSRLRALVNVLTVCS